MTSKGQKVLVGLCVVSLALNFFLGGIILGKTFGHRDYHQDVELRSQLSDTDRMTLRQEMHGHKNEFKALHRDLRQAQQDVESALAAEPFRQDVLDAALAKQQEIEQKKYKLMSDIRSEAAAKLSPEGRKIFFDMTSRRHKDRKNRFQRF